MIGSYFSAAGGIGPDPTLNLTLPKLVLAAGTATFLVALLLWSLLLKCSDGGAILGGLVGAVSGFLAHPVTWGIVFTFDPAMRSVGDVVTSAFVFSMFSLLLFGVLTVAVTGLVGAIVGRVLRTFNRSS